MIPLLWAEGSGWSHMFELGLPVFEKILRPIVVYFFLVGGLRIFGKRELAQINPLDIVVLLSLANTVQNAIIGEDNSVTGGLIGAATLLSVNYLVVRFLFKHRRLDQWVEGKPVLLVSGGRLISDALAKELITEAELLVMLHRQGFTCLDEIEKCEIEPGGTLAIEAKIPRQTERRHVELLAKLEALSRQVADLRAERR